MSKILLDTNIASAYLDEDEAIISAVDGYASVFIPAITVGELYYGAYNSQRIAQNIIALRGLIQEVLILKCDKKTGDYYGRIKYALKRKGRMIPDNDIWIAALAQQYDIPLFSADKHFTYVDDLDLVIW